MYILCAYIAGPVSAKNSLDDERIQKQDMRINAKQIEPKANGDSLVFEMSNEEVNSRVNIFTQKINDWSVMFYRKLEEALNNPHAFSDEDNNALSKLTNDARQWDSEWMQFEVEAKLPTDKIEYFKYRPYKVWEEIKNRFNDSIAIKINDIASQSNDLLSKFDQKLKDALNHHNGASVFSDEDFADLLTMKNEADRLRYKYGQCLNVLWGSYPADIKEVENLSQQGEELYDKYIKALERYNQAKSDFSKAVNKIKI